MKWHLVFGLVLSLTCLLAVPRAFGAKKEDPKPQPAPAKKATPPPQTQAAPPQAAPSAPPPRTRPQPVTPTTQASPNPPSVKTSTQSAAPAAKTASQSSAPTTKTGPKLGAAQSTSQQTGPGQSGPGTAGASKSIAGTPATRQHRERSEYVLPDTQVEISSDDVESDTPVPAPEVIESDTPVPAQDQDDQLSHELIDALTAGPAPPKFVEPVTPVPAQHGDGSPSPKVFDVVSHSERPPVSPQVNAPVVKSSADHRADQKKVAGPSHPSVVAPSAVRKIDGQYAVWNHGWAHGVKVGDEVGLVRGGEKIGRGQVIAVRANDCDLEIAETYAVASVAVGDGVKLLKRAIVP